MVTVPSENTAVILDGEDQPSVDWSALFGAVIISAASLTILTAFGVAVGLASVSPWTYNPSGKALAVAAAAWFAITALYAGAVGGYIAGRLRKASVGISTDERTTRDGVHGLIAWGLGSSAFGDAGNPCIHVRGKQSRRCHGASRGPGSFRSCEGRGKQSFRFSILLCGSSAPSGRDDASERRTRRGHSA